MKKIWYILFTVVFFLTCLVPGVGMLIDGPAPAAANEIPAPKPRLTRVNGKFNANVLSDMQTYMSNGFFLRLEGITAWDTLNAKLFNTSPNDSVIIGPDGWLFYSDAADVISGANQMTDRQIWCAARSLALMQEYAESQGAQFVVAPVCGKDTLYPAHAPSYVTVAESSDRERLLAAAAEQGANYVNLYDVFTQVDEELYWHLDSHWNSRGAALGADAIMAALGEETDYFAGPFTAKMSHTGDLYEMVYPTGTVREADYSWDPGFTFEYLSNFHSADDITIETENEGVSGSLVMFRDSSGRSLYPYMAQSFGRAIFSRQNNYDMGLVAQQQATAVVVEISARTLDYLVKYPPILPAPERDEAVLTDAIPAISELEAEEPDQTLEGYVKLTGTIWDTRADPASSLYVPDDAPIYVAADGAVYEAIPNEGGFTAFLPSGANWQSAQVYIG